MKTRNLFLIAMLLALAFATFACAAGSNPSPETAPATVAPTQGATGFDLKTVLDKYVSSLPDGFGSVQPAGLKDQMANARPFILDVRETSEVAKNGFIEGSVNLPIRTLTKNLDKLPAKDQPIVTLCSGGHRGGIAMTTLQLLGYTNVKNLIGGFNAWKAAGLPVATGTPAAAVAGQSPNVDRDLFAVIDKYVTSIPDGYGGAQPAALKDQIAQTKTTLIDVRDAAEITQNGKIEGSLNVPLRTLVKNLDKLSADKTAPVATYCPVGQKGVIAMTVLQLLGYSNTKNLLGGFNAWKAANLPIVQ